MISWCVRKTVVFACVGALACFLAFRLWLPCLGPPQSHYAVMVADEKYVIGRDSQKYVYDRYIPLIFIGGMPRSGTTLLRVLLDAHPYIRCGEETRVIPRLLGLKNQWQQAPLEAKRLQEAGITGQVLDNAVAAFTLEIIARHGEPAPRLCNKDPFTLRSSIYLHSLFPNAKFILLLRDGRAVVHSIITRKVTITGLDIRDYRQCLRKWSSAVQAMFTQCHLLGPKICLPVHYEHLVLHPEASIRRILNFLSVPWNDSVLHHERLVGKPGGVSLSILERSTDQVIKPINMEALTKWVGKMPDDVVRDMPSLAPMLLVLGYDPRANPPDCGKPDALVLQNTYNIQANRKVWDAKERQVAAKREILWRSWLLKFKASEEEKPLPESNLTGNFGTESNRTISDELSSTENS